MMNTPWNTGAGYDAADVRNLRRATEIDRGSGSSHLTDPGVAEAVAQAHADQHNRLWRVRVWRRLTRRVEPDAVWKA